MGTVVAPLVPPYLFDFGMRFCGFFLLYFNLVGRLTLLIPSAWVIVRFVLVLHLHVGFITIEWTLYLCCWELEMNLVGSHVDDGVNRVEEGPS